MFTHICTQIHTDACTHSCKHFKNGHRKCFLLMPHQRSKPNKRDAQQHPETPFDNATSEVRAIHKHQKQFRLHKQSWNVFSIEQAKPEQNAKHGNTDLDHTHW